MKTHKVSRLPESTQLDKNPVANGVPFPNEKSLC
jgi:hypothetical protein